MVEVIQLAICQKCHKRIANGQGYTRYKNSFYHDSCFVRYLDEFDLTEFIKNEILVQEGEAEDNEPPSFMLKRSCIFDVLPIK